MTSSPLDLAFGLYSVRPWGGLQRDFLRIAGHCRDMGHRIHVFAMDWAGEIPPGFSVNLDPVRLGVNHQRSRRFGRDFQRWVQRHEFDQVIGFNRLPGLDIYFAADPCYVARIERLRGSLYRWSPRYRYFAAAERELFSEASKTQIVLMSPKEKSLFREHYQTPESRLHLFEAGLTADRLPRTISAQERQVLRSSFDMGDDTIFLLSVGSGFRTKGLERSLRAIASLPVPLRDRVQFVVVGQDRVAPFARLAQRLGLGGRVRFAGGREDVMELYAAADVLLHPALSENTGAVILEAIVSGLPAIVTDNCGNAHHVTRSGAGSVLSSPFQQDDYNRVLKDLLESSESDRQAMSDAGRQYGAEHDFTGFTQRVAAFVVERARAGSGR